MLFALYFVFYYYYLLLKSVVQDKKEITREGGIDEVVDIFSAF